MEPKVNPALTGRTTFPEGHRFLHLLRWYFCLALLGGILAATLELLNISFHARALISTLVVLVGVAWFLKPWKTP